MLIAVVAAFIFALSANFAPFAYAAEASLFLFLAIRFSLSFGVTSLTTGFRLVPRGMERRQIPWLAAMSTFMLMQSSLYLLAIYHLPVSLAVCLFFLFPVFTYVMEIFSGKLGWNPVILLGFAMAMVGTWVLVSGGEGGEGTAIGVAAGIAAAVAQGLVNLAAVRTGSVSKRELLRAGFALPMLCSCAAWLLLDREANAVAVGWSAAAAATYLIGMLLYVAALRLYGTVRTSTFMYVEPVFTIVLGVILHSEAFTAAQVGGALLIAAAIATVEIRARKLVARGFPT